MIRPVARPAATGSAEVVVYPTARIPEPPVRTAMPPKVAVQKSGRAAPGGCRDALRGCGREFRFTRLAALQVEDSQ